MKQALLREAGRLTAARATAIAAFLILLIVALQDLFPGWALALLAVLAALCLIGLGLFRSELRLTRGAVVSRDKLLLDSARRARKLYNNDVLTGLPNRTRFRDHVAHKLTLIDDRPACLAVGILTLHNLETIQDLIDDDAGDELVSLFAGILNREIPNHVGYVGPGLFAFLLDDMADRKAAFATMQTIIKVVSQDLVVAGLGVRIQVSGGLAIAPADADTATGLIQKAKLAMTNARKTGAQLLVFNKTMAPDHRKMQLIADLKTTLEQRQLKWALQPQYDAATRRVVGAELLVRWLHPEYGWIPPTNFIRWAEQTGLIARITEAAIEQACIVLQEMKKHPGEFCLSVNLSANDLADSDLVAHIIERCGDCASMLTLEITETALMTDMDGVIRNVEKLKQARIKLSLDDYGTGYSSLEYLQAFSFDEIKIDRMFVEDLAHVERNLKLTRASIELGHNLGAIVVAEGVEDKESADLLVSMGCDVLQGYYIGKPALVNDIEAFLDDTQGFRL